MDEQKEKSPRPVLVVGMHRSGTSMVAGLLHKAGVHMGEHLLGAGPGNPHGHFEEEHILGFHRKALRQRMEPRPLSFDDGTLRATPLNFDPSEREIEEAEALVAQMQRPGLWGWKDPRTCLFLPFWLDRLPNALIVAVYRHPLEVYESHLRRANNLDLACSPSLIWDSYRTYNQEILTAARSHSDRFLIASAHSAAAQPEHLLDLLEEKLDCPGTIDRTAANFVRSNELRGGGPTAERHEMARTVFPEAVEVFEELESLATLHCKNDRTTSQSGSEGDQVRLAHLQKIASDSDLTHPEAMLALLEAWALESPADEIRQKREQIYTGIQIEISERDRVLSEVRKHQAETAAYAKSAEKEKDEQSRQIQKQNSYADELEKYIRELEETGNQLRAESEKLKVERHEALCRLDKQWRHIERQNAYARELEETGNQLRAEREKLKVERHEALCRLDEQWRQIERQISYARELEEEIKKAEAREAEWNAIASRRFFRLGRKLGLLKP